ncbi:putative hydrolase of the HAD superfamily [Pedobacter steynii]|uniref:Putative hydrolase of the HAD superfamily n=1 Tax=Pedobacter steynii TaxID=430522 RepID=A0A1G9RJN0_9SPHI|nr:HAD family phosphatase [Pedobacter steynii]NQX37734.1 HAD family phosphatase [Pedobacter steynii]SDM23423.1 putative hydrolase of the HAD superfamily [Pedobacter steynii]
MKKIKNIIFDYGNVIFEIDFKRAQTALIQLGITNIEDFFAHKSHHDIFNNFETAAISPAEFRAGIREASSNKEITDEQIDAAWNSLLIGVPANVHEVLLKVKEKYRTFLLSNNNEIHYNWIVDYLKREFDMPDNSSLFERAYYSQQMFLRKPHVEIFEQVLTENKLDPEETLFIDDSPQHLVGAKQAGMQTLLMTKHPKYLEEVLTEHQIL